MVSHPNQKYSVQVVFPLLQNSFQISENARQWKPAFRKTTSAGTWRRRGNSRAQPLATAPRSSVWGTIEGRVYLDRREVLDILGESPGGQGPRRVHCPLPVRIRPAACVPRYKPASGGATLLVLASKSRICRGSSIVRSLDAKHRLHRSTNDNHPTSRADMYYIFQHERHARARGV